VWHLGQQALAARRPRRSDIRIEIPLRDLTQGHGQELANSLNALVLAGVISRNEARTSLGLVATDATGEFYQPVNVETTDQAENRNAANSSASAPDATAPDIQAENVVPLTRGLRVLDDAYLDELEHLIDAADEGPAKAVAAE
jgi:hypothetical protein